VTVVPFKEAKKGEYPNGCYRGLIHSINESERSELRRYINTTFFKELEEKKASELEQFQALNEQKKLEKEEEGKEEEDKEQEDEA